MKWTQIVKAALVLAVIVAFFWFLWMIKSILIPFGFASLLAYLFNPVVRNLHRKGLNRDLGASLSVMLLLCVVLFVAFIPWPILSNQLAELQTRLPLMMSNLEKTISNSTILQQFFPASASGETTDWFAKVRTMVVEHTNIANISQQFFGYLMHGGSVILNILTWVILLPVITYYLLAKWPQTVKKLRRLVPIRWRDEVFRLSTEMDAVLSQYVRGQFFLIITLATYYAVALSFTGLDVAISVGILTGCFVIIPYLGFSMGFILGALSALLQFGFDSSFFAVLIIYGCGQLLESYILTPRLVGERIGLSPAAVIFALMMFGTLFGFVGVLFALPASAVVMVVLRHVRARYVVSDFYRMTMK